MWIMTEAISSQLVPAWIEGSTDRGGKRFHFAIYNKIVSVKQ